MANSEQIKALIQSHYQNDEERFRSIALQIAAQAAMQGHGKFAIEVRHLFETEMEKFRGGNKFGVALPAELQSLLSGAESKVRISNLVFPPSILERLDRILLEQKQRSKIREYGLQPRNRILFVGPPGCGKTMTAHALAGELKLPIYTIQLDSLITKYMGETASKLRLVFDAINRSRGVYFFDEFDAIGGKRNLTNDVGEIRRVLNSFLQFIERSNGESIVVAATNHHELLDRALFRRFDDVIHFDLPSQDLALRTFKNKLSNLNVKAVDWAKIIQSSEGFSYAEITKACENAAKSALLSNSDVVTTDSLMMSLEERRKQ